MPDPIISPEPHLESPIPIEETPEIPMDPSVGVPPPPPMPKVSRGSAVVTIFIFIILFVAGVFLSGYIRPFLAGMDKGSSVVPTPQPKADQPPAGTLVDPFADWQTSTASGFFYKLPPAILMPTCDGTPCVSQGTYLPGGTRFTVAAKTASKALSQLQGAAITDASGTAFTSHDSTVSGHTAIEFTGAFSGITGGGFGFSQMHGFMIEISPVSTLEINHFTPAGVTADFAKDDELFTKIISTLSFSSDSARPLTPERRDGERATGTQ